jgi:rubrerythrin
MKLHEQLHRWFLSDLFSTARGRAYVLSQAAEAESGGEKRIFDVLLEHVREPELERMVKKHSDDETRHAAMYRACADRQGVVLPPIPEELRIIDRIDEYIGRTRTGGERFFDARVHDERYVMEAYLFLQVLEERAVQQFTVLGEALRPYDRQSADVVVEIEADERRHLRYCHAISKRYAPSADVLAETLAQFRLAEAQAYQEHTRQSLEFILSHGFLTSRAKTLVWRGIGTASTFASLPWTDAGRPTRAGHVEHRQAAA